MRFTGHKYIYMPPCHSSFSGTHHWELRGPIGGIHFHVQTSAKYSVSAGLEYHHSFDPTRGQTAPQHTNCPVVGGRCWHEGTSLYASEHLWPVIEPALRDGAHDEVFRILEREYESHFQQFTMPSGSVVRGDEE